MQILFPPSRIIYELLLLEELIVTTDTDWKGYMGFMPNDPDQAVCIYDTDGLMDGRVMKTGERIIHPGIQIIVRGKGYAATYRQAQQIALELDATAMAPVIVDDDLYFLQNFTRTSQVLHLGRETEGDRNRHMFSINGIMTMVQSDDWEIYLVMGSNGPEPFLVKKDGGGYEVMLVRK